MASHNATSYAAIPKRHSNDRLSLDDISPDARFKSNSSYEYPLARDSVSDDESHPRITESTSTAQAVPLAGEHESKGDVVQPVQWRVSLYTPLSMIALFISGLLVAVGHHIFYSRLVGTYVRGPEEGYISQVWIIRYGTAFAFVTKTLLAGSIVIAYKQYMWINLQHKANSVSTIDAVFAATHDLLAFLHPSFWSRAKIPALMALIAWCLPLAALVPPSALTVNGGAIEYTWRFTKVPALNLNNSALYKTDGLSDGTSPLLHRLTLATATGMRILPMRRILPINTTYTYEFDGPSLKCESATEDRLQNMTAVRKEAIKQILIATNKLNSVDADIRYLSFTASSTGVSTTGAYNVTKYVNDCIVSDGLNHCGLDSAVPTLWVQMGNESITCTTYNTHFKANFGAIGALDSQPISNVRHEWKDPLNNDITSSMLRALSSLLNGYFGTYTEGGTKRSGIFSGKTMIVDTALLELLQQSFPSLRSSVPQEDWMRVRATQGLAETVEELSRNQTLSLFSNEALWLPMNSTPDVMVIHESNPNLYGYRSENLWLPYGVAIVCSFFAVLLGLNALWFNGVSHDNSFSTIMAVTRNAYLDRLTIGQSLGATPMGDKILRTRLRFGVLEPEGGHDSTGVRRAGFGTNEQVGLLKKGQVVY